MKGGDFTGKYRPIRRTRPPTLFQLRMENGGHQHIFPSGVGRTVLIYEIHESSWRCNI